MENAVRSGACEVVADVIAGWFHRGVATEDDRKLAGNVLAALFCEAERERIARIIDPNAFNPHAGGRYLHRQEAAREKAAQIATLSPAE